MKPPPIFLSLKTNNPLYMNPFHFAFDKLFPAIRFVYEKVLRHRWFDEITPNIWLGGAPLYPRDYDTLLEAGIDAVINIRAERHDDVELYERHGIDYLQLKVLDLFIPADDILDEGVAFIHKHVEEDRIVLVHCAKGRGRSVTLLAAYLMRYKGMSFTEVDTLLREKRPLSNLQYPHQRALEKWMEQYEYEKTEVGEKVDVA